ncbi:MAG TPA: ABC transporter ATP-binding protein [Gammaproteobacteria bacterium]|nr:ABC transporter ATP-binding protein [Gammaproteobacteria bacterium]|tara:strand:- start:111 stop:1112 length:1002 start_codon:yes stop_codon:yes gene_type:complete
MNKLLKLSKVSKSFHRDRINALKKISFACGKGNMISIVGSSGSGKSTLLRIIAGLEIPDEGQIILDGNLINDNNTFVPPEKRNCSLVFQDFALFPNMTVKENIFFGKNAIENKVMIDELMKFTILDDLANRYPHEISGGQQQRVALVRALSINPTLLLLDEPLSHLDYELKDNVRNELVNLIKKVGATVLMVSHDTEDAMIMADKVLVLNNGLIEQFDTPSNVFKSPVSSYVARLFGKTNILPLELFPNIPHHFPDLDSGKEVVSIRPHELKLLHKNNDTNFPTIKGEVISIKSFGSFYEVLINEGELKVLANIENNQEIKVGDELTFYIHQK